LELFGITLRAEVSSASATAMPDAVARFKPLMDETVRPCHVSGGGRPFAAGTRTLKLAVIDLRYGAYG
jgi:hypothetical protein